LIFGFFNDHVDGSLLLQPQADPALAGKQHPWFGRILGGVSLPVAAATPNLRVFVEGRVFSPPEIATPTSSRHPAPKAGDVFPAKSSESKRRPTW